MDSSDEHRMLLTHCSGHRLQLAVSDAMHTNDSLWKTGATIPKSFKRLRAHSHGNLEPDLTAERMRV